MDADALTYINALSTPPSAARQALINTFIVALKAAGVWTKLDGLYDLGAAASPDVLVNMVAPGTNNLTYNGTGTLASKCTANVGWQGNGTDNFLQMPTALNALTNYQQDSAHIAAWSNTYTASDPSILGSDTANVVHLNINYNNAGDIIFFGRLQNVAPNGSFDNAADGRGFYVVSRSTSTLTTLFKNGRSLATSATVSSAVSGAKLAVAKTNTTLFSSKSVALAAIGSAMTTEVAAYRNAVHEYIQGVRGGFVNITSTPCINNAGAFQGCATDGTTVWTFSDRDDTTAGDTLANLHNNIETFNASTGASIARFAAAYTGTTGGLLWNFVDGTYYNGYLYVCCTNHHSLGPGSGYVPETAAQIVVLDPANSFAVVTTYALGAAAYGYSVESVKRHGTSWWVSWSGIAGVQKLRRFNDDFSSYTDYACELKDHPPLWFVGGTDACGANGIEVVGDYLFLLPHGPNVYTDAENQYSPDVQVWQWTGAALTYVTSFMPPTFGSGQGLCRYGRTMFFADRVDGALVKSTLLTYATDEESVTTTSASSGVGKSRTIIQRNIQSNEDFINRRQQPDQQTDDANLVMAENTTKFVVTGDRQPDKDTTVERNNERLTIILLSEP